MIRRTFLALLIFAAAPLEAGELHVSAAASLSEAMTEISALYDTKVQLNFGGSNALARQIEAGAPCDVFFSADEATLNQLLGKNLIDQNSVTKLLGNSLVVIAPAGSTLKISAAKDLASSPISHLALGDPAAVPAGVYTRKWLESQNAWETLSPKVVATENVRAALAAVASGNAEAGIVYKTDAMTSKQITIVYDVPPAEVPPIVYPAAATKSAADPVAALRFLVFLQSDKATAVFKKHGFIPLPAAKEK
jgi:molybdate transport system substrate-binding protein